MTSSELIFNLGLDSVADNVHRHPLSGSNYTIRGLLEKLERGREDDFYNFVNSSSDACSLETTLAEKTDLEWRAYIKGLAVS